MSEEVLEQVDLVELVLGYVGQLGEDALAHFRATCLVVAVVAPLVVEEVHDCLLEVAAYVVVVVELSQGAEEHCKLVAFFVLSPDLFDLVHEGNKDAHNV